MAVSMANQPRDTFACPACNRRFAWQQRNIGIKFHCVCGHTRVTPPCPDSDEQDVEGHEPLPVAHSAAADGQDPSHPAPPPAPAPAPVLAYEARSREMRTAHESAPGELVWLTARHFYVPAALVVSSGALIPLWDPPVQMLYIPMALIGSCGLALSLKICDPNPGPLANAIVKFAATVLAPFTVCISILYGIDSCFAILFAPAVCLAGHALLLVQLFEVDMREAALSTSIAMLGFVITLLVWWFVMM